MNHTYRLVWSRISNSWIAVAENVKSQGKSSSGRKGCVVGAIAGSAFLVSAAMAAPVGGQISAGSGTITQSGLNTTINQASQNLAINWQSFGIAANEAVRFNQPGASSIALNRITGQDPSQILGSLSANGQVFILNPNGVLFGNGSQVNVGGLVASTLSLSDADFMAGKNTFSGTGGSVVNQGTLTAAQAGYIALLAPEVLNEGVISATLGTAVLAAGNKITLNLNNGSLLSFTIDQGALNALADNKQLVQADGGQVYMSAKAADTLSSAVVNNTGVIQARTIQNVAGVIKLIGDMEVGTVNVGGTLDASAPNGGNGGFIETSAAHVHVANSARVTTLASNGLNGTWLIDPVDFTIAATGGDMTGATLTSNLTGGNITIQSTLGATGTAGDINVNDAVSWSANLLTLNAQNNININAVMDATATASLALEYGQGTAAGNTSKIVTGAAGKVNLPASTTNFTTKQGSNGVVKNYTVITALGAEGSTTTDLQGMKADLAGNYVLGADIDACLTGGNCASGATTAWNSGAGFAPIGYSYSAGTNFAGTFDGLGHTISNLTINRPGTNYVGLFGNAKSGSVIRNVGLVNSNVTGGALTGALVGGGYGTVSNSYTTGNVTSQANYVGGLAGYNTGTISNSYSIVTVAAPGGYSYGYKGGLVGTNYGTISNSHAAGTVTGSASSSGAGGLVGNNNGTISNSYVNGGSVSGGQSVGGLVGNNGGTTSNSHYDIDAVTINGATGVVASGGLYNTNGTGQFNEWLTNGTLNIANYASLPNVGSNSYTISSVQGMKDLLGFADNAAYTFTLANSITLIAGLYIPYLAGTFDGGSGSGFTISGLNLSGGSKIGLFGTAAYGSAINNVALLGGSVSGGSYIGALVGYNSGTIANSSSTSGNMSSSAGYNVGGLVGRNQGSIVNSHATGSVSGNASEVGGLVGRNYGTIDSSYAAGSVTGNYGVGGLVGYSRYASVSNSYVSSGSVVGSQNVGGLTGVNMNATVTNSHYDIDAVTINGSSAVTLGGLYNAGGTGQYNDWLTNGPLNIANYTSLANTGSNSYTISSVQGMKDLLGFADNAANTYTLTSDIDLASTPGFYIPVLAGTFDGAGHTISNLNLTLNNSYVGLFGTTAAGSSILNLGLVGDSVNGANYVGGLAGKNNGTISNSYTTGGVVGWGSYAGGLAGYNTGAISNSYATGSVSGGGGYGYRFGGLVGQNHNTGTISNSYATGSVNSNYYAGGLVGLNYGGVSNSYATGSVSGNNSGGLIGYNNSTSVTNSFWDTTTSGQTTSAAGTGMATADMMTQANFTSSTLANGGGNPTWDLTNTWVMYEGLTAPLLRSFMTALTVTANGGSKTYDGVAGNGVTHSVTPNANLLGAANYGVSQNVGSYTTSLSGLYSNQQGYIISYVNNAITVNAANLSLGGTQVYNGSAAFAGSNLTATGVNGETFTVTGAGDTTNLTSKDVQTGRTLASITGLTLGSSTNGGLSTNYNALSTTGSLVDIAKADATVTANSGSATYSGVAQSVSGFTASGLVNGETASVLAGVSATGATGTNAGSYTSTASGTDGNYNLSFVDGNLVINKADATVTANSGSTTYSGVAQSVNGFIASGLVNGETEAVLASVTAGGNGTNAGSYASTASGTDGNYNLSFVDGNLVINKADATVTANSGSTTYSGVAQSVNGFTASGLVNGETASVLASVTATGATGTNAGSYASTASGTDGNYNLSFVDGNLVINKADATVTANSVSTTYSGVAQSVNGFTASGLVNGETASVLASVTAGGSGTNAGSYASTASGTDGNYNLTFTDGALTIDKADATVTANSGSGIYSGVAQSVSGFTANGLVNGETASVLAGVAATGATGTNVGSYANTASGTDGNYNLTFTDGALTIDKADATVTANSGSGIYSGVAQSVSGFTASGLVNGETASVLSGVAATGATGTNVGSYTNTASGTDGNYNLTFADGALTIDKAHLTVTANDASRAFGAANPTLTTTVSGFVNNETASVLSGAGSATTTAGASTAVGSATITAGAGTLAASNYDFPTLVDGVLTITPTTSGVPVAVAQVLSAMPGGEKLLTIYATVRNTPPAMTVARTFDLPQREANKGDSDKPQQQRAQSANVVRDAAPTQQFGTFTVNRGGVSLPKGRMTSLPHKTVSQGINTPNRANVKEL